MISLSFHNEVSKEVVGERQSLVLNMHNDILGSIDGSLCYGCGGIGYKD